MIQSGKYDSRIAGNMQIIDALRKEFKAHNERLKASDKEKYFFQFNEAVRDVEVGGFGTASKTLHAKSQEALKGVKVQFEEHSVGAKAVGSGSKNNFLQMRETTLQDLFVNGGATSFTFKLGATSKKMNYSEWIQNVKASSDIPADATVDPGSIQLIMGGSGDWDRATGADHVHITVRFKDKKGNYYTKTSKAVVPTEFMKNDNAYTVEQSREQALSAVQNANSAQFRDEQLIQAANHMGRAIYGESYSRNFPDLLSKGTFGTVYIKAADSGQTEWVIEKNDKTYSVRQAVYDPNTKTYKGGKYLHDPKTKENIIFNSPDDIPAVLGGYRINLDLDRNKSNPNYRVDLTGIASGGRGRRPATKTKVIKTN